MGIFHQFLEPSGLNCLDHINMLKEFYLKKMVFELKDYIILTSVNPFQLWKLLSLTIKIVLLKRNRFIGFIFQKLSPRLSFSVNIIYYGSNYQQLQFHRVYKQLLFLLQRCSTCFFYVIFVS